MAELPWLAAGINVPLLFYESQDRIPACGRPFDQRHPPRFRSPQRHPEHEPRLLHRGGHFERSAVAPGNLGGDVETQSEALRSVLRGAPVERLEQPAESLRRDRLAEIGD